MKKLLATLLIMLPAMAIGQQELKGELIDILGMCVNRVQFAETITSYGEVPFMIMTTTRPTDETMQSYEEFNTVMFMNPSTLSWTLAEKRGDNNYCVIGVGKNIQPYVDNSANNYRGT